MKRILILLLLLSTAGAVSGQNAQNNLTITGKVIAGDDKLPLTGAYVILNASDSAKLTIPGRVVLAGEDGGFTLRSNEPKSNVTISYIGYKTYFTEIGADVSQVDLGNIVLSVEAITIDDVLIQGRIAISKISGDTIQFNAAAFKTNPDATTEDLLKKMPGITTDDNGSLESQGQKIEKVYVNGKEYFEDDPSLALKSLPADAVESIQLYDGQSDQARFSGFDDGERLRSVNIVTKPGVTNSTFGKVYGGYGTDDRYSAGLGVNSFMNNHRLTVIGQSNNINNQGFTLNDIASSMGGRGMGRGGMMQGGGGMGGGMGGGGGMGRFAGGMGGGIRTANMAGLNYNGEFSEKFKLSGNYFFSGMSVDNWNLREQDYLSMARQYSQNDTSKTYNYFHNAVIRGEWNPNEFNRINFSPRVSYSTNHGNTLSRSSTWMDNALSNASDDRTSTDMMSYNMSMDLWWQHRLKKAGRTISLGGIANQRKAIGDRFQLSDYGSIADPGGWMQELLDRYSRTIETGTTLSGSATYAEPLSQSSRMSFNYSIRYDKSVSDAQGFDYDQLLQEYSIIDPLTTNYFNRNYTTQTAGIGYNLAKGNKFTLNATVNYQNAYQNYSESYPRDPWSNNSRYTFSSVQPSLGIRYNPSRGKSLNIDYNSNSIVPSVNQLQDILDVSNLLQVSRGNPGLKQGYTNRLNIRYNSASTANSTNFNLFATVSQTSNYIANHRMFLTQDMNVDGTVIPAGAQYTTPVNLQGYWNTSLNAVYSFALSPIKSNVNMMGFYRYGSTPSIEDNIKYRSNVQNIGVNLSLTSNISENVDFTFAYRPSINLTKGGTNNFDRYWGHSVTGVLNIIFWKGFFINADASWRNNYGTSAGYSQHFALLNAAIGKKFLKYRQAEFRLWGYDLLNQNRSFWQSASDTYIQTSSSKVLKRFFLFSFTYKFDTRKGRSNSNYGSDNAERSRGFGGPPPGGGGPGIGPSPGGSRPGGGPPPGGGGLPL